MSIVKDLYKKLSRDRTSEELFSVEEQPENNCPLIDQKIKELKDSHSALVNFKFLIDQNYLMINHVSCNCSSNDIQDFESNVYQLMSDIKNLENSFIKTEQMFEKCRSYLTSIRANAQFYKDDIWAAIDRGLEINEDKKTYKIVSRWGNAKNMKKVNDHIDFESVIEPGILSFEFNKKCDDPEECGLYSMKLEIQKAIPPSDDLNISNSYKDLLSNKELLENYVESVQRIYIHQAAEAFINFIILYGYSEYDDSQEEDNS